MKEEKVFLDIADYIQVMGRCNRIEVLAKHFKVTLLKTNMKKYTIKEFAEGKKAVKIENEEQWNKLNKVHKLNGVFQGKFLYGNDSMYSSSKIDDPLNYYRTCNWEVLEFSQLDFEDEFVVGKWYKLPKTSNYYAKYKTMQSCSEYISNTGSHSHWDGNCNFEDAIKIDLSEIQQYLPSNHPDLMKKDTFVLPEKWAIKPKKEEGDIIREWFNTYRKYPKKHESIFYWHFPYYEFDFCEQYCYSEKQKDYTEITFDQFQQYVLKTTKTMEKEIIGYKLVKPKYEMASIKLLGWNLTTKLLINISEKGDIHRLKEAGVLDLWFEAVYAPEYKIGDWVYCLTESSNDTENKEYRKVSEIGSVFQIDHFAQESGNNSKFKVAISKQGNVVYIEEYPKDFRLANPEEIKAAQIQLPTINGYSGSYKNGIIKYGCAEFSKMFFEHLNSTNSHLGNRTIKSIELSSGVKITIEEIKQIVEYINNNK